MLKVLGSGATLHDQSASGDVLHCKFTGLEQTTFNRRFSSRLILTIILTYYITLLKNNKNNNTKSNTNDSTSTMNFKLHGRGLVAAASRFHVLRCSSRSLAPR